MRSIILILLSPLQFFALDLADVKEQALRDDESDEVRRSSVFDCFKDIGVKPLETLSGVRPYQQILVFDFTIPMATLTRIRLLFVQAICYYAAASGHIDIGYIALVNKHAMIVQNSLMVRDFISAWTESDDKLLNGIARHRPDVPLTQSEKANLFGEALNQLTTVTDKPIRILIFNQEKSEGRISINSELAQEFGKALRMRNISQHNVFLDEVACLKCDGNGPQRISYGAMFTIQTLEDTEEFLKGMKKYAGFLQTAEAWKNDYLDSTVHQNGTDLDIQQPSTGTGTIAEETTDSSRSSQHCEDSNADAHHLLSVAMKNMRPVERIKFNNDLISFLTESCQKYGGNVPEELRD